MLDDVGDDGLSGVGAGCNFIKCLKKVWNEKRWWGTKNLKRGHVG